ncbi:type VII secretion target [Nocardia sp. NPDC051570]|uniref:type VII secretion target n=1 Tax=Nocardia sp. NPDC051570 TaxID=3364324 RepID=UPI0037B602D8
MGVQVSPEQLRQAASELTTLSGDVADTKKLPPLGAGRGMTALPGSPIAAALTNADAASATATSVLRGRLEEMANLLTASANAYHDTDTDAAARLAALGDLNSGSIQK